MPSKFPANARLDEFRSPECRLSYAQSLFKARVVNNQGAPKYGCTLIFPKKDLPFFREKVIELAKLAFGASALEKLKKNLIKQPLLMGDGKEAHAKETGELHKGMGPDVFFIRPIANEDRPPKIHSYATGPHVQATQSEVYSGCYGFAVLNAFPWNHAQSGDGISFGISLFQKTRDGESLGGAAPVDSEKWYVPDTENGDTDYSGGDKTGGQEENPFA
jgi:Protein of unknown function (DUF2815)